MPVVSEAPTPIFEFRDVSKSFGPIQANDGVTFSVARGSIHGVVGENGAGKSTIMKILYGLYSLDSGNILVNGKAEKIHSPAHSIELGIGMVHQHFMLVPTLTVWENIILGMEPTIAGWLQKKKIRGQIEALTQTFGFNVDADAIIEDLPVGHQQQVEILKLLYRDSQVLILDEPTAVLTPQEVERLFDQLRFLSKAGRTIVLITHKLKEILQLADQVTVMRSGRVIITDATSNFTETSLAEAIIGRRLQKLPPRAVNSSTTSAVLKVENLQVHAAHGPGLKGLSLEVNTGEIVGIAGVEGNGQHELVEILAGVNRRYGGQVGYLGQELRTVNAYHSRQTGMAIIPPDRHREAVLLPFTIWENLILGHHREARITRGPLFSRSQILVDSQQLLERFDVRPRDPTLAIASLSGGNQQKAVIARELRDSPKFLLAAHPTRGVDIGAIEFIHGLFLKLRDAGTAILLISSELDEILALSDRILVLYGGQISGAVARADAEEKQIGLWMTCGAHNA